MIIKHKPDLQDTIRDGTKQRCRGRDKDTDGRLQLFVDLRLTALKRLTDTCHSPVNTRTNSDNEV